MTVSAHDLAATHARAFTANRAWTAQEFSSLLTGAGVILCGDVRSFILGRVVLDEAEVLTIATDPAQRRQGLARRVLRQFLQAAGDQGAAHAFLEVAADNHAAIALYKNENFSQIGQRPNYYTTADGTKVGAVVMQYRLSGAGDPPTA